MGDPWPALRAKRIKALRHDLASHMRRSKCHENRRVLSFLHSRKTLCATPRTMNLGNRPMNKGKWTQRILFVLTAMTCLAGLSGCKTTTEAPKFLAVASTTPADGETQVNVRPSIQIVLDAPIDETSLADSSVLLVGFPSSANSLPVVPATLSYAAQTKIITIRPSRPLWWALNYKLTVTGLRDTDGNPLQPFQFQFQTFGNRTVRRANNFTGAPESCMFSFPGEKWQPENVFQPGPDGVCFTADDVIHDWRKDVYDHKGTKTQELTFGEPGPDAAWFTADDELNRYTALAYRNDGTPSGSITYTGAGPDGEWFTADDRIGGWSEYVPDSNSSDIMETFYVNAGADQLWFTKDDHAYMTRVYSPDQNKHVAKIVSYYHSTEPASSVTDWYSIFTFDTNGNETSSIGFADAGSDGTFFTTDDHASWVRKTTYDGNGGILSRTQIADKGPDGSWFTTDDLPSSSNTIEYDREANELRSTTLSYAFNSTTIDYRNFSRTQFDQNGNPLRYEFSYGADASDQLDSLDGYQDYIYDATGNLTRTRFFADPGTDGQWFNADDTLAGYDDFKYAPNGNRLSYKRYFDPGIDGLWFTADDILFASEEFDAEN